RASRVSSSATAWATSGSCAGSRAPAAQGRTSGSWPRASPPPQTLSRSDLRRTACFKLAYRRGDQRFVRRFAGAGRPGAYLRILAEGELAAGDPVEVVHRPGHGLTIAEFSRIYHRDRAAA